MKNKVSFDFDSTLDRKSVQEYAKDLIKRGFEVWICTSRLPTEKAPNVTWNDDLYKVAKECGINKDNIIFTAYKNKSEALINNDFIFHIDDDNIELDFIKTDTDVTPIFLFGNKNWKEDCETAINLNKDKLI